MPCHACNPYCGKCRPPKERPMICTECEKLNFVDEILDDKCKYCGNTLPLRVKPKVLFCGNSGLLCANPCGKAKAANTSKHYVACPLNTPPD